MAESAKQREERMARAATNRMRPAEGSPPRRSTAQRTQKARMTVDMPPALRRRLKSWTGYAATELDVMEVAGAEVVRILIEMLTATREDPAWDDQMTPQLARRVLGEVAQRIEER
ncbi:hypothetical protein ACWDPF_33600 [Streptomyces albogriseolus]